jgi:hypothetical protein
VFETFRGISHLLMEKVTKDLRRAPGTSTNRPAPAAVEPVETPTPREQVRASAPPVAPVQAIHHEAQSTPAPLTGSDESKIDYGREIELPGMLPGLVPASSMATAVPVPEPVVQMAAAVPVPAFAPAGPSPSAHSAQPAISSSPAFSSEPLAHAAPQPVAAAEPQRIEATAVATTSASAGGQTAHVTVPVQISKGGKYEIVIKLQLEVTD